MHSNLSLLRPFNFHIETTFLDQKQPLQCSLVQNSSRKACVISCGLCDGVVPAEAAQGTLASSWHARHVEACKHRVESTERLLLTFYFISFCFVWFCFVTYSLGCGASCDSAEMLAGKHRSLTISHLRSHNNLVNLINENHAVLLNRLHCLLLHLQYHAAQSMSLFSRNASTFSCKITEAVAQQY